MESSVSLMIGESYFSFSLSGLLLCVFGMGAGGDIEKQIFMLHGSDSGFRSISGGRGEFTGSIGE